MKRLYLSLSLTTAPATENQTFEKIFSLAIKTAITLYKVFELISAGAKLSHCSGKQPSGLPLPKNSTKKLPQIFSQAKKDLTSKHNSKRSIAFSKFLRITKPYPKIKTE